MAEHKRMTTRFKELFEQQKFFVMAGGMNPIGAKMAEALGYEVFYMSGGNTAAHQLGWPDSGSSMRDTVDSPAPRRVSAHYFRRLEMRAGAARGAFTATLLQPTGQD